MNDQDEILNGLMQSKKRISPKFLYDERGSEIFEQICELEEYYPAHAEHEILKRNALKMAEVIGNDVILIEPGCGNCIKVQYLLNTLKTPTAYVALDISKSFLLKTARSLQVKFPAIPILKRFLIPSGLNFVKITSGKRVYFTPSTIGYADIFRP